MMPKSFNLLLVLGLMLTVAACGPSSEPEEAAPTEETAPTEEVAPTDAPADGTGTPAN